MWIICHAADSHEMSYFLYKFEFELGVLWLSQHYEGHFEPVSLPNLPHFYWPGLVL